MVEMDNIHYDGNTIVMFVYPEGDRNSRTEVIIDAYTLEILSPQSINTYISMARWRKQMTRSVLSPIRMERRLY